MATKQIAWNTGSGNITLTYTGQGNGSITVQTDVNNLGSARSQVVSIETSNGAVTKNLTVNQAACPFPVNTVKSYSYTGSYQEVVLPAGQYKLQCWGAQGGSNGTNSTYGITAQAGGKGGYSEGIITLSQNTTVRVYVGGQGSSSSGGYNGGGSTTGTSLYNASNEFGYSKMGGGGGATDIRLSDGALLSRMIVAGGGSGGAMCYQSKTTTTTTWNTVLTSSNNRNPEVISNTCLRNSVNRGVGLSSGKEYRVHPTHNSDGTFGWWLIMWLDSNEREISRSSLLTSSSPYYSFTPTKDVYRLDVQCCNGTADLSTPPPTFSFTVQEKITTSSTTTNNYSQVGFVGGGTSGGGTYPGTQTAGGNGAAFGAGKAMSTTGYRYCSGAGGGGWYGGGSSYSDSYTSYIGYSGGGSGWVNTAASAGNRPSGYTGPQLDSGETKAGNTSFPSTNGGTETGHSGNGYAKITRLS